jgi:hypothetical protein
MPGAIPPLLQYVFMGLFFLYLLLYTYKLTSDKQDVTQSTRYLTVNFSQSCAVMLEQCSVPWLGTGNME